jgi:hypothetical protein
LNNSDVVKRLLFYHGEEAGKRIVRVDRMDGEWRISSLHPKVGNASPGARPFAAKYSTRTADTGEIKVAQSLMADCIETLRKGSVGSSTKNSASERASIGRDASIMCAIPFDKGNPTHVELSNEMLSNSLIMDRLRFMMQSSTLLQLVLARLSTKIEALNPKDGKLCTTSYIRDSRGTASVFLLTID